MFIVLLSEPKHESTKMYPQRRRATQQLSKTMVKMEKLRVQSNEYLPNLSPAHHPTRRHDKLVRTAKRLLAGAGIESPSHVTIVVDGNLFLQGGRRKNGEQGGVHVLHVLHKGHKKHSNEAAHNYPIDDSAKRYNTQQQQQQKWRIYS